MGNAKERMGGYRDSVVDDHNGWSPYDVNLTSKSMLGSLINKHNRVKHLSSDLDHVAQA